MNKPANKQPILTISITINIRYDEFLYLLLETIFQYQHLHKYFNPDV